MRILIDINHPGQVHLFKHAIWQWESRGHEVLIVALDKDVTIALLKEYGLPYTLSTTRRAGLVNLLVGLLRKTTLLVKVSRQFKPDLFLSLGSVAAAWTSTIVRKPNIAFEDTEHSVEKYVLYAPFTDVIFTPACFTKDLGRRQRRYEGYHELAYLHPNWFTPTPNVLHEIGLREQEPLFIVRFVSFEASHDVGWHGLSYSAKKDLVSELQKWGRVIITSESPLPPEFEPFRLSVSPAKIHDLLYYSSLFIGEGGTMVTEAAMLGRPSIQFRMSLKNAPGTHAELEQKYGLVHRMTDEQRAIELAIKFAKDPNIREEYRQKRQQMLVDKIDVTAWMIDVIEGYMSS